MPIYEYKCSDCGLIHEIIQKFSDAPITQCPSCKGLLKKMISNTSFILKGSGWYVTDHPSEDRKKDMISSKPEVSPAATPVAATVAATASAPATDSTSIEKSSQSSQSSNKEAVST
jgi:putative FmdB family regulatory protein